MSRSASLLCLILLCACPAVGFAAPLLDGLGGPIGYGEPVFRIAPTAFDLTGTAGGGLRFYDGPLHRELYIDRPGSLSFDEGICCFYTARPLPAPPFDGENLLPPRIVAYQVRGGQSDFPPEGPETFMYAATVLGDGGVDRFVATWHDVPDREPDAPDAEFNSWQAIVTPVGDAGDFDLEVRFARCEWLTEGNLPNRPLPLWGFDAGQGADGPGWMWSGSLTRDARLLCELSNVREPGVFRYAFRGGWPSGCGVDPDPPPGPDRCADGNHLPGDGCSPACYVEPDVDGDGRYEAPHPDSVDPLGVYDVCSDPALPQCDDDSDDDMVPDIVDNCREVPNPDQHDYDGDNGGDVCDPDADNDGLDFPVQPGFPDYFLDPCPFLVSRGYRQVDPELDAIFQPSDLDRDGLGDACDDDDDGDGVIDCGADGICRTEDNGYDDDRDLTADEEGECQPDAPDYDAGRCERGDRDLIDNDGDGFVDERSERELPRALWPGPDDPADGAEDNCRRIPNADQIDTDGDGVGDACDDDFDGDGVLNCRGGRCGPGLDGRDNDGDGLIDELGECAVDCDPLADLADQDRDGFVDEDFELLDPQPFEAPLDNCPKVPNPDQSDRDGDGVGDACADDDGDDLPADRDNCPLAANPDQADLDGDGEGDACDLDDDGDDIDDIDDVCPRVPDDQTDLDGDRIGDACDPDDDADGVNDPLDLCPRDYDPDQADLDGDGMGDVCDADDDGDDIDDVDDVCPRVADRDQRDTDGDGEGDACDADDDGDGVDDRDDVCPLTPDPSQADLDGDRAGDACDADDDGDGIEDAIDGCPRDADDGTDTDGDGIGDVCDDDDDGDGIDDDIDLCPLIADPSQADLDGDGIGDACDPTDDRPLEARSPEERCDLLTAGRAPTADRLRHCPRPVDDGCIAAPGRLPSAPAAVLALGLLVAIRRRSRTR